MCAVDGGALGAVDGGGVAEVELACRVLGRDADGAPAAAGVGDAVLVPGDESPSVAVLDEVSSTPGRGKALVAAGDDPVPDSGDRAVVQLAPGTADLTCGDAIRSGSLIERGDLVASNKQGARPSVSSRRHEA